MVFSWFTSLEPGISFIKGGYSERPGIAKLLMVRLVQRVPKIFPVLAVGKIVRGTAAIVLFAACLLTCSDRSFAQVPARKSSIDISSSVSVLTPGTPIARTLQPGESATFSLVLHANRYSQIQVQQIQGMNAVTLIDATERAGTPRYNDGGAGSVTQIAVIPAQNGDFQLEVKSRERHIPVRFQIILQPDRAPQACDKNIVQAQEIFAEAEWIRRSSNWKQFTNVKSPADVLSLYDRAIYLAEQSQDVSLQREALTGKARYQIFRFGQYQQGAQTATLATKFPPSSPDIGQQALAWKTLATAQAFIDRYDDAIDAYQIALALYQKSGDSYWQGIVLGNLAAIYLEVGDSAKALNSAEQSAQLARKLSDDYGVAFTQMTIGEIHQERGEFQKALSAYQAALAITNRIGYAQAQGELLSDMGQLYSQLGDWDRATESYRQALPVLQKDGDAINEIQVLGHLGDLALHSGHPQKAREYFRQGLVRAKGQNLVREETFLDVGLARTCVHSPCSQDPLVLLSRARTAAHAIHQVDGEAAVDDLVGEIKFDRNDESAAMQAYRESAALWREIPNSGELATVEADMARLENKRNNLQAALQDVSAALDSIESSRSNIGSDALRTSYFSSKRDDYGIAIDILMQLDRKFPHRGYAERAWAVAERARARTLLDDLRLDRAGGTSLEGSQLLQKSAALEIKIHDSEDRLSRLGSSAADVAQAQQLQKSIRDMLLNVDQVESHIRARTFVGPTLAENTTISSQDFRRRVLDRHTVLLEYWIGDSQSYLWTITGDGIRSFRLPARKNLNALVHAYQKSLLARDSYIAGEDLIARYARIQQADRNLTTLSRRLSAILLPVHFDPAVRTLILVPDGSLQSFPFAALEPSSPANSSYLIEHYSLVYEPSAFTAEALLAKRAEAPDRRIAIFADPVYSNADSRVQHNTANVENSASHSEIFRGAFLWNISQLPRLPASRQEASAIARIAGPSRTSLFLGFDASPGVIENLNWQAYAIAHFAAHAIVDTDHPELSGIVLSMVRRDGTLADGVLWLHDIYRLKIPVSLVTLSGCQTADGQPIPGEGINGLSRAFLYAGAKSVIGTLWDAEDNSSSMLMQSFYREFITHTLPAATALRSAQIQVLSSKDHRPPYYWAGFVLEGGWRDHP